MSEDTVLASIPQMSSLASYAPDDATSQNVNVEPINTFPYMGFFSEKASKAAQIRAAIPNIGDSEPYLRVDEAFYPLSKNAGIMVLRAEEYWAEVLDDGTVTKVSFTNPGRDADMKHEVLAEILVHDPEWKSTPFASPMMATVTSFRSTKVPGVKDLLRFQQETREDEWVTQSQFNAALAQNKVPFYARAMCLLKLERKMSRGKVPRPYMQLSGIKAPEGRLLAALKDLADFDARLKAEAKLIADEVEVENALPTIDGMKEAFDKRLESLRAKIS